MKKLKSFAGLWMAAVIGVLLNPPTVRAQTVSGSEDQNLFGNLGQNNAGVTQTDPVSGQNLGPQACAPTSTANALTYLENYIGFNPFQNYSVAGDGYQAVNNLAAAMGTRNDTMNGQFGTTYAGIVNGISSYISPTGANPAPSVFIAGGQWAPTGAANNQVSAGFMGVVPNTAGIANNIPTAQFLASALNAHEAIEIGIQWGSYLNGVFTPSGGGHAVALDSISMINGSGTIGLLDSDETPTGAVQENATVSLQGGYLYVTYPVTISGSPLDDNPAGGDAFAGNGDTGRIIVDLAETVPEGGATSLLLGASFLGLIALRRTLHKCKALPCAVQFRSRCCQPRIPKYL